MNMFDYLTAHVLSSIVEDLKIQRRREFESGYLCPILDVWIDDCDEIIKKREVAVVLVDRPALS